MQPASAELLELHAAGDPAAAGAIYERYAARLIAAARRMLADKIAARIDPEDVVQSAYRSFFLHAAAGDYSVVQSGDLWRLLIAITRHKLLHAVERETAGKRTPAREQRLTDWAAAEASPQEVLIVADELAAILGTLTPVERRIIELRLRESPIEQIARDVNKSSRTVRRHLLELRRIFERRLQGDQTSLPNAAASLHSLHDVAAFDYRDLVLEQLVGAGAFGKVYRAFWKSQQKTVAVKVLRKRFLLDRRAVEQFVREAAIIAQLRHPGIIGLHGLGRTPAGGYFLVLDYHPGGDLTGEVQRPLPEIVLLMSQAAAAIEYAHERGIVHCDLKPSNLLLAADESVVITDFGFAFGLQAQESPVNQPVGGTVGYLAPELWHASKPAPPCDIYSLGCILGNLLDRHEDGEPLLAKLRALARQCQHLDPAARPVKLSQAIGQVG